jgi:molybdopterin synthase catalytic subunit
LFQIVHDTITPPVMDVPAAGGFVLFEGRVRDHNDGRSVLGIEYEAYAEMAEAQGEALLAEARERFGILEARAIHRVGQLAIGDAAVWVGVAAAHRGEAFRACEFIMDEIKKRLPIWKKEHYANGDRAWIAVARSETPPEA